METKDELDERVYTHRVGLMSEPAMISYVRTIILHYVKMIAYIAWVQGHRCRHRRM